MMDETEIQRVMREVIVSTEHAEAALNRQYPLREVIAYLRRVGLHASADRMSRDRQVININDTPLGKSGLLPRAEDEV